MSDTLVQYEVEGRAARLTLDSPHNRNALSSGLVRQLREGLQQIADLDLAGEEARCLHDVRDHARRHVPDAPVPAVESQLREHDAPHVGDDFVEPRMQQSPFTFPAAVERDSFGAVSQTDQRVSKARAVSLV